jgi:ADP-heptose:LPS heptosyltransferase
MRRVDRWIGVPLCAGLTGLAALAGAAKRLFRPGRAARSRNASVSSIVFVKLAEQGSTVLAWSAIENAIARVGRDHVYFVVFEENRAVLDAVGWLPPGNILAIPTGSLWSVAAGVFRAVRCLRRLRVDAAVDLEFFARSSAILAYLSGAIRRVGFHAWGGEAGYRGDLSTHRVPFNPYLHTSQAFEILVDALDHPPEAFPACEAEPPRPRPLPEFRPTPADVATVRRTLHDAGWDGSPMLLLNANASDLIPLRRWPPERYVELARRFLASYPSSSVVFTGGPGETDATDRLVRAVASDRCLSVAGRTSFRDLLTLYTLSDLLVTNDSGPGHFAALTPVDVVTLFGPETPALFGALSPRSHALWAGIVCSPCLNAFNNRESRCTNNVCMQQLSVDQVFEEVARLYEQRRVSLASG